MDHKSRLEKKQNNLVRLTKYDKSNDIDYQKAKIRAGLLSPKEFYKNIIGNNSENIVADFQILCKVIPVLQQKYQDISDETINALIYFCYKRFDCLNKEYIIFYLEKTIKNKQTRNFAEIGNYIKREYVERKDSSYITTERYYNLINLFKVLINKNTSEDDLKNQLKRFIDKDSFLIGTTNIIKSIEILSPELKEKVILSEEEKEKFYTIYYTRTLTLRDKRLAFQTKDIINRVVEYKLKNVFFALNLAKLTFRYYTLNNNLGTLKSTSNLTAEKICLGILLKMQVITLAELEVLNILTKEELGDIYLLLKEATTKAKKDNMKFTMNLKEPK